MRVYGLQATSDRDKGWGDKSVFKSDPTEYQAVFTDSVLIPPLCEGPLHLLFSFYEEENQGWGEVNCF